MKKTIRSILAAVLATLMILSLVGCDLPKFGQEEDHTPNYDKMIDNFVSTGLNTFEMTIGDEHAPNATVWLKNGRGLTYSSDTNVVTVTDLGKVTAVGEGTAYVVIVADNTPSALYEVYRYDVYGVAPEADLSNLPTIEGIDFATEIANFNSTQLNTATLKIGMTHSPTASVWASAGGTCYTSDASVVTVAPNGTVTAVGKGTAYVIIKASVGNMFEISKYIVNG